MSYIKTAWVNDSTPSIDAVNLNNLETQYDEAIVEVVAVGARVTVTEVSISSVGARVTAVESQTIGSVVYGYKNFGGAL